MLKRRSFLAMLGLSPAMPALAAKEPLAEVVTVQEPLAAEAAVMANVRMPVQVGLTQAQVDFAEAIGMPVWEYAKNLMILKEQGRIEGDVRIVSKSVPVVPEVTKWKAETEMVSKEEAGHHNPDLSRFWGH